MNKLVYALVGILTFVSTTLNAQIDITSKAFGKTKDGKEVIEYSVKNSNGMTVKALNYGGIITEMLVADKDGKFENVILNLGTVSEYENLSPYFGAIVGRYGNRIGSSKFTLNGTEYKLNANNGKNCLHGGNVGFDKKIWKVESKKLAKAACLKFSYTSADGEENFPGELKVEVKYVLTDDDELIFSYKAESSKDTICNLTQHTYFNLTGKGKSILGHIMNINADKITPTDDELITTGEFALVENTPFDFRTPKAIGENINDNNQQIKYGAGYDHNFVLNKSGTNKMEYAASVFEPESLRVMHVYTTEPGVQFYTGNYLDSSLKDSQGRPIIKNGGFAFETQHFPDSPNRPEFPSVVLKKGEVYETATMYKFGIEKAGSVESCKAYKKRGISF